MEARSSSLCRTRPISACCERTFLRILWLFKIVNPTSGKQAEGTAFEWPGKVNWHVSAVAQACWWLVCVGCLECAAWRCRVLRCRVLRWLSMLVQLLQHPMCRLQRPSLHTKRCKQRTLQGSSTPDVAPQRLGWLKHQCQLSRPLIRCCYRHTHGWPLGASESEGCLAVPRLSSLLAVATSRLSRRRHITARHSTAQHSTPQSRPCLGSRVGKASDVKSTNNTPPLRVSATLQTPS